MSERVWKLLLDLNFELLKLAILFDLVFQESRIWTILLNPACLANESDEMQM